MHTCIYMYISLYIYVCIYIYVNDFVLRNSTFHWIAQTIHQTISNSAATNISRNCYCCKQWLWNLCPQPTPIPTHPRADDYHSKSENTWKPTQMQILFLHGYVLLCRAWNWLANQATIPSFPFAISNSLAEEKYICSPIWAWNPEQYHPPIHQFTQGVICFKSNRCHMHIHIYIYIHDINYYIYIYICIYDLSFYCLVV